MNQSMFEFYLNRTKEVGYVEKVTSSVIVVSGLPGARLAEMVWLENGLVGTVGALGRDAAEVLVFSRQEVETGVRLARTGDSLSVPVGAELLGQTVDALGRRLDGRGWAKSMVRYKVNVVPVGIAARARIGKPFMTGVTLVDTLVPLGCGQRELVMGDRKTGKTQILLQTILTQAKSGTVCVYAAIGKRKVEIKKLEEFMNTSGVGGNMVLVAASSHDSPAEINQAPQTAMTIAEYFRDSGRQVMVVLDDMTTHAKFYRELSLLAGKFPGRDSYPGDIFHEHSRLLERAGNFKVGEKEVAITLLPVVETVQGDMTGYIQTNTMSMTDGHMFLDAGLFFRARRPAIDPFVSVTRVGHQTQTGLRREVSRELLAVLSAYERSQSFLRFGAELGESSRQILAVGERIYALFDQPVLSIVSENLQVVLVGLIWAGLWNGREVERFIGWHEGDPAVKTMVDGLVTGSDTMSKLLSEIRGKTEAFSKVLK